MADISLREYIDKLREDDQKAISAALAAAKEAVAIAETNAEKWRDSANEWRAAMTDREHQFLTRKEFYTMIGTAISVIGLILALNK